MVASSFLSYRLLLTYMAPAMSAIFSICLWINQWTYSVNFINMTKLVASDGADSDQFGRSVSQFGDYALIGAWNDDVGANNDQGSAYIFLLSGTAWSQQAKLVASDGGASDKFGVYVSLFGDYALIGSYEDNIGGNTDQGSAYIFFRSGTLWNQQAKLLASDGAAGDKFGYSVSLSGDYALIGAWYDDIVANAEQGSAYIFLRSGITWNQQTQLTASDGTTNDQFGISVSLSGEYAAIGAFLHDVAAISNQGSAYIFFRSGTLWNQQAKLIASDGAAGDSFGIRVSLSGDYALIGSYEDNIGGNTDQGSAYIFFRSGTDWNEQAKLFASDGAINDQFGVSVSIDGDYAAIGAYFRDGASADQGSTYIFFRAGTLWNQQAQLVASDGAANDQFGIRVSLSGDYVLIGAVITDSPNLDQGSSYLYHRNGASWTFACPTGTSINGTNCDLCVAGKYNDLVGQASCADCSTGKYNDLTGSTSISACLDCEAGKYNELTGQSSCVDCLAGRYGAGTGLASCSNCVIDTYQDDVGQSFCDECPLGTCTNGLTGQISCDICSSSDFSIVNVSGCDQSKLFSFATENCPTVGGVTISLFISNSSNIVNPSVTIDGNDCPVSTYLNGFISCDLPAGVGIDETVRVTDGDVALLFAEANLLSYALAIVTSVSGCDDSEALPHPNGTSACSRAGNDEVTVSGNNFGYPTSPAFVQVGGFKGSQIPLSARGLTGWEQNTTIVVVPAGSGLGVGVNVQQKGGELGDGVRMLSYKSCDPGYYNLRNEVSGIYDCAECDSGDYNLANESFSCEICPAGSYCSSSSISSCDLFLTGSSSPSGSTDSSSCICPSSFFESGGGVCSCDVGFGYDGDSCVPCSQDSIKPDVSLSTCVSCKSDDPNSVSNINVTACICGVGFVMADQNCEKCVVGMICDEEGLVLTSLSLESGHWRESSTDLSTRECPYENACTGSSDISNQCLDGHSGPLCAVCEDGYDSGSRFESCERCFDGFGSISFLALIVAIGLIIMFAVAGLLKNIGILSLLASFIGSPSIRVKMKIFLIYCQIISQFQSILSADYPSNYSSFLSILQIFNFDLSSILSLKCFNQDYTFHDEMMVSTLLPIFICMLLIIGFSKSSFLCGSSDAKQRSRSGLIEWLLFVLYFFFSSSSRAVFEMFNCDDDFESGSSYLRADYRLTCSGSTYESYRSYAIIMILIYPIGIPLLFFFVLHRHRNTINMEAVEAAQGLDSYLNDAREHEITVARRLKEVLADYRSTQQLTFQKKENIRLVRDCNQLIEDRLKIEYSRVLPELIPYAFLYEAYRPSFWYWECVECVRRLSLTGLLVFMYPGSDKQIMLAMILCMMFMILYSWTRPFLDPIHNFIIGSAKWGIFLQLFGTLLLKQGQFAGSYSSIGDLMVVVGVLFPLIPMLYWQKWTESMKKMFSRRGGRIGVPSRKSIALLLTSYLQDQGTNVENPVISEEKGPKL